METLMIYLALIALLLLCLIATVIALLFYSGVFERFRVGAGKSPLGEAVIAYKFSRGAYESVGQLFTEAAKIAPDNKAIGIFYDRPHGVEAHNMRLVVASVLAENGDTPDPDTVKKFEQEGFKLFTLPLVENSVRTTFTYKSFLSVCIASQRVYPKLKEYIEEHSLCAHPFLEIYDGKTIQFMAPLSRQGEFYVPEALKRQPGEDYEDEEDDSRCSSLDQSHSDVSLSRDRSTAESGLNESLDSPGKLILQDSPDSPGKSIMHDSPDTTGKSILQDSLQSPRPGKEEELAPTSQHRQSILQDWLLTEKKEDHGPTSQHRQQAAVPPLWMPQDKEEQGSDEDSSSSFEEVKMEAEGMVEKKETGDGQ